MSKERKKKEKLKQKERNEEKQKCRQENKKVKITKSAFGYINLKFLVRALNSINGDGLAATAAGFTSSFDKVPSTGKG